MKISVVMPVYNERDTIREILSRVRSVEIEKEIICVDDFSTDGTRDILRQEECDKDTLVYFHEYNQGKGAAVRTGLQHVSGDVVIIQDADLEYDPQDYHMLLKPIMLGRSKVVYGSRFLGEHKAMYYWHSVGNKFLTWVTNVLYNTTLTDMETCYKVFTAEVSSQIRLTSPRWGFDPELTSRILRKGHRIYEVPISYTGREFHEGKKISWKDAFVILYTLIRCRITD